ncbi:MAG: hypothetical protein O2807_02340 [bacterium]|nr:hypothetical protein [bacterium]
MPESPLMELHEARGARFIEEAGWKMPADFGDPGAEHRAGREGAALIDLSHRGIVRFSGPDAESFLHNMLSSQVVGLRPGEGRYGTFLTRQGKLIADLTLYRTESGFLAELAPGAAPAFMEAIGHYIIMDQVEVEDLTGALCAIALSGPKARACLAQAGLPAPDAAEHSHCPSGGTLIARELWTGEEGFFLIAPHGETRAHWERLVENGAVPAGLTAFGSLSLEAGVPLFGIDMDGTVNPMQAGLETRAIDFGKGCYVGQEVIAKIKYLGQVNRGLAGIRIEGEILPPNGAKIWKDGDEVGTLTRAAHSPTLGKIISLSYLHRNAMAAGTEVTIRFNDSELAGCVAELPFYRSAALSGRSG